MWPVAGRLAAALAVVLCTVVTGALTATPARADTVRQLQWHLKTLRVAEAHKINQGAGVVVAVADTGVQANHQDLQGQVLRGRGFATDAAADGRTESDEEKSHGTGMASLIAGRGGGDMRLLGIAPKAKILPVSLGADPQSDGMARGIRWAAENGAKVINISLTGATGPEPDVVSAVEFAQQQNAVVVVGAGNTGATELAGIALVPGVVVVTATNQADAAWTGSTTGSAVGVSAPGVRMIYSAVPSASPNGYLVADGTSAATAVVSGVVALIRSRYPTLDAANVINRLVRTSTDRGPAGRDPDYGFGVVNPVAALTANVPTVAANPLGVASTAEPTPRAQRPDDSGPAVSVRVDWAKAGLFGVGCLLAVVLIVVLVVWQRRRRPPAPASGYPGLGPPPGGPQPGYGYPPSPAPGPSGTYPATAPGQGYPAPGQGYPPATAPGQGYPPPGQGYPPATAPGQGYPPPPQGPPGSYPTHYPPPPSPQERR